MTNETKQNEILETKLDELFPMCGKAFRLGAMVESVPLITEVIRG